MENLKYLESIISNEGSKPWILYMIRLNMAMLPDLGVFGDMVFLKE